MLLHCSAQWLGSNVLSAQHERLLQVPFGREVWIEESDFREVDAKDYYGLAPGKSAMLR